MTLAQILQDVGTFFSNIFSTNTTTPGYATQIVTWVSSTPIAMLGIYTFILVALCGVARRFIPGV